MAGARMALQNLGSSELQGAFQVMIGSVETIHHGRRVGSTPPCLMLFINFEFRCQENSRLIKVP